MCDLEIIIMNIRAIIYATIVAVNLGYTSSAIAEDMDLLPEAKTQNGVTYLSGGFGLAEVTAMKAAANGYALMLICAIQDTGKYLADIKLSITDSSGTAVLDTVIDGPILLAQLPPGQYRINADSDGKTVNRTVQIRANHPVKLNLYWPER